jgi:branched-chain amino acid aminotransferase
MRSAHRKVTIHPLFMNSLWKNGHWLSHQDFSLPASDRGLLLGLGLFETFLALDGRPIFLPRHLSRLRQSCEFLKWPFPNDDFPEIARELLLRNSLSTGAARCRLTLTAGSGPLNDLSPGGDLSVWMSAQALATFPESISACLSPWPRNEHSPLSGHKCTSYAENSLALDHARRHGFDQALFLNTRGDLCEAATANLFFVKNGTLLTPPLQAGCLPGITRALLLELADTHSIPSGEEPLTLTDLAGADECFLTSSLHGILPITRLPDRELATGPLTRRLQLFYAGIL